MRQAVNLATDRSAVIKLFGGPALAQPTCQILPTAFPAYKPFCPYTKGASASGAGAWTAPDVAKANSLIAASGTKGMAVKVFTGTDPFSSSVGGYFVSLLNQLGYKAQLKRLAGNVLSPYVANSKNKVQMALTYWLADYPAPSNFLTIPVGCSGFQPNSSTSTNWSEFCDKSIDALGSQGLEAAADRPDRGERALDEGRRADDASRRRGCRCSSPSTPRSSRSGSATTSSRRRRG